ncbi:MAG: type II toxin-antitoxin system RatA family toxin [Gammaproteobacteria bacterium]|jgi:ribosome-associated toxin RatA of RatAB toxin-antitoxin module
MRELQRSALVPHAAVDMYGLVNDVRAYPEFLPWCRSAVVHSETERFMEASLELYKGKMSRVFTTRNQMVAGERIEIGLVDGPFRHLEGHWFFESIDEAASEVRLEMRFEFDSLMGGVLFGPVFEDVARSLVDAFVERARDVYGRA